MRILFSSLLLAAPDLARAATRTEYEYRDPYDPAPAAVEVEDATGVGGGSEKEALCDPDLINEIVQSAGDWWPTPRISMTLVNTSTKSARARRAKRSQAPSLGTHCAPANISPSFDRISAIYVEVV
ncbi:hypothetical protein THAOC_22363 [Thalassiosira oceanica]|uniref:Uncharacterized protein n=1 Tax=Thalassiosira oceanica TaxID=159749 RepID=K0RYN9_THAOC|nr:hypothetical protein THAOC_22363 [Thalassiosira oceanica]|eukprot:EJK57579.1 hypothetical protein THAOC_22363 [Thalassiosira oceanica]